MRRSPGWKVLVAAARARVMGIEAEEVLPLEADLVVAGVYSTPATVMLLRRLGERIEQIGAVHLIVREAEGRLHRLRQRCAQQRLAVVPAALVPGERLHTPARQRRAQVIRVRHARENLPLEVLWHHHGACHVVGWAVNGRVPTVAVG